MAEITNGYEGAARTAARVEILAKMPARAGMFSMVSIGPAMLNAAFGVVRARVSFWQGDQELCEGDVLLHSMSVRGWEAEVRALIAGEVKREVIYFSPESPELVMTTWRHTNAPETPPFTYYEMMITLASGVFDPSVGVGGDSGPGVLLSPEPEELLKFAQDLLAETESMLKPKSLFRRKS